MRTSSRRRMRLELQSYQCSRVVLMDQSNCFFPVNEKEEEEEVEDENKQQEKDEIRTTVVPMQQSCTHGPKQLFLSSE